MKSDFFRRAGSLVLCLALALSLAAFPALAEDDAPGGGETGGETGGGAGETASVIKSVTVEPESLTLLRPGETGKLTAALETEDGKPATGVTVTWASSDADVATVDKDGTVTAVKEGKATVTATADGKEAKCEVEVLDTLPVRLIEFTVAEILQKDTSSERRTVNVVVTPPGAGYTGISFSSDDTDIVKIEADKTDSTHRGAVLDFKDSKPGETYIYAKVDGTDVASAQCRVIVSGIVPKLSDKELTSSSTVALTMGKTETVSIDTYGDAKNVNKIDWYSENNTVVSVASGRLTPRSPGTTKVTAMRGNYSASFNVTVKENETGLVKIDDSVPAGTPLSFADIRSDISEQFEDDMFDLYGKSKTLSYITSLNVSPSQGVLYYGYISEANTGSGVSLFDRFYYSGGGTGDYLLSGVTFVPSSTFSGKAEISYTAVHAADNSTVSGVIRISVDAMEDVSYTTGSGQNVFFRGSDFNTVCRLRTGRELSSVTFTLPSSSRGTLYYNYTADDQYSEKVEAATRYRRTGNPNLDSVSFLPADKFDGSVRISYRGTDTAGGTFSGYVTVTVTELAGDADVHFTAKAGKEINFTSSRFNTACREATGESLEYVRFTLPDSADGTLYYTSGSTERKVTEKTAYYRSSSPSINDVSFIPAKNAPDQIYIDYSGHSNGGTTYSGTILIDYSGTAKSETISYSAYSGRAVQFDASDFNTASIEATGSTLNYVYFDPPAASRGLLYYNYTAASTPRSVNSTTRYYRSASSGNRIGLVFFLADPRFTGTAEIGYTGHANNGETFTGTVSVRVSSLIPAEVRFSGSASQPISLSASQIRYACNAVMDDDLSYIEFNSLPSSSQGRIYRGYTGYDSGTQVVTGTPYYVSASPGIDQLSFVPRGGFSGVAYAGYTGVSTSGEKVSGQISFTVTSTGTSAFFNDMAAYSWAVPAADYLYQNGIINGVGSGQYAPGQNIRRCDFVVMLCRAYNLGGGSGMSFADVPANSYYASAVSTASGLGIVNGDGRYFRPNDQLTRQDAMVIVKRTLEAAGWSLGGNTGYELSSFGDGGSVSAYARDAVAALVRLGAVNGDSSGNIRPWAPINRAEAAVMLHYVLTM